MKQERTKKKVNGLLVFSICLLIIAIVTPLTFALFTDYKQSTTEITFGKIQIDAGKTRVDTNIANLLPTSPVLSDKVVVAKDVFSESYILRAKHEFKLGAGETPTAELTEYLRILSGGSFAAKDAYGEPTGETASGFILTTQAVDAEGRIWASVYNPANGGSYTSTAVDIDGVPGQDTVGTGYAKDYRWYYHDGYFYLCEYFENAATDVAIKEVEKSDATETTVTLGGDQFDLTTQAGRNGLINYFDNVKTVTVSTLTKTLSAFKTDADNAKTAYNTAVNNFNTAKASYTTAYEATNGTAKTNLTTAQNALNLSGDALTAYNTYNDALMAYLSTNDTSATFTLAQTGVSSLTDYVTAANAIITLKGTELAALGNLNNLTTPVQNALTAYNTALANYSKARDLIAVDMADYQELFVFALGGEDYNTIPRDLYQLQNQAQYGKEFVLSLEFNAVQSDNLRATGSNTDLDLSTAEIADLVDFFE